MARLLAHVDAQAMLEDQALCARVVEWKNRVFARGWARYDLAKRGTFRLLPPRARRAALSRDYAQMRPIFLAAPADSTRYCRLSKQLNELSTTYEA
jgi:hypothetical protein